MQRMHRFEENLAEMQQARTASADHAQKTNDAIIAALNAAAERIERVAAALNAAPQGNGQEIPAG
jgi:hypothetical protein